MPRARHALAQEALALDPAERLELATELIDSIEGSIDSAWSAAWAGELRRRSETADGREKRGAEWGEVRARLLEELAHR